MAETTGSARPTDEKQDDVRHRILLAAREEFAAHGLAGARVDRIARSGRASKERLYAHFTDKESLFHAVLKLNGVEFFSAVTLDPADLPGFVGQLFDHAYEHPQHRRMLAWARLDGLELDVPHSATSPSAKVQAVRRGQEEGHIDPSWDPHASSRCCSRSRRRGCSRPTRRCTRTRPGRAPRTARPSSRRPGGSRRRPRADAPPLTTAPGPWSSRHPADSPDEGDASQAPPVA